MKPVPMPPYTEKSGMQPGPTLMEWSVPVPRPPAGLEGAEAVIAYHCMGEGGFDSTIGEYVGDSDQTIDNKAKNCFAVQPFNDEDHQT